MSDWRENIERVREALESEADLICDEYGYRGLPAGSNTSTTETDARVDLIQKALAALTALTAQIEELEQRIEELEAVAGGVIWLDNNIHNYGSDAWHGYFKATLRDARRALAQSDPPEDSE